MPENTKIELAFLAKEQVQILSKQRIKKEGINIIAFPHTKPQIYSRVLIVTQLQFPVIEVV